MKNDSLDFLIRRATMDDAGIIARHRARMFYDMGEIPDGILEEFRNGAERWLTRAFGEVGYVGWLASENGAPDKILAGAGVQLRQVAPHPRKNINGAVDIAQGRHAIVVNVFTEPEWRRRGLGARLMNEILQWARVEKLDRLVLHASAEGRGLYERLGFAPTNEMRFSGDLAQ